MSEISVMDEAGALFTMIESAVKRYAKKHKDPATAKKHRPVSRVDLIYSLGDGGSIPWVHLNFDTKPGAEPDGAPTHPDFGKLKRPSWLPAVVDVFEGKKATFITVDGKQKTKKKKLNEAQLAYEIGVLLKNVLLAAKSTGYFDKLPKAKRCELGVEDPTTGAFGWPNYEDRGKDNLIT